VKGSGPLQEPNSQRRVKNSSEGPHALLQEVKKVVSARDSSKGHRDRRRESSGPKIGLHKAVRQLKKAERARVQREGKGQRAFYW